MKEFQTSSMLLLQIDLEGSSTYGIRTKNLPDFAEEKYRLAEKVKSVVFNYGFELISWKGDGGVYAADATDVENWDFSVDAADAVATAFDEWRDEEKRRSVLRLRISIHHASRMMVHKESGYWTSDDLNIFMKYEREISVSGTIAVTDSVYQMLQNAQVRDRFVWQRDRSWGKGLIKQIHHAPIDSEATLNRESPFGFFAWLSRKKLPKVSLQHELIGPQGKAKAFISDSCILFAAPHPESSLTIDFEKTKDPNHFKNPSLNEEELKNWEEWKGKVLKRSMGINDKKVSVCSATTPLSDVPASQILYKEISWRDSRSFHALLDSYDYTYRKLAPTALNIMADGTNLPGIACCHMIVRTADDFDGTKGILLCQRQKQGAAPNLYAQGRWSLSCEEQMRPGESVMTCVQRGLTEELLGSEEKVGSTIRILGAILEPRILNFCIVVLVDIPMKFREVVNSWQNSVDKDEHRLISLINGDQGMYEILAKYEELTPEVQESIHPSHKELFEQTKDWKLHNTTLVRFAFTLWAQEMLTSPE